MTNAVGGEEESTATPQEGQLQGTHAQKQAEAAGNSKADGERQEASDSSQ